MKAFLKDPAATEQYTVDFTGQLAENGLGQDAITGYDVAVPIGLTLVTRSRDGAQVSAWIGGGVIGLSAIVPFVLRLANPAGSGADIEWRSSIRITVAPR